MSKAVNGRRKAYEARVIGKMPEVEYHEPEAGWVLHPQVFDSDRRQVE